MPRVLDAFTGFWPTVRYRAAARPHTATRRAGGVLQRWGSGGAVQRCTWSASSGSTACVHSPEAVVETWSCKSKVQADREKKPKDP